MENDDKIDFENATAPNNNELSLDDFSGAKYIKNPEVGGTITLDIESIQSSDKTKAKGTDGIEFDVGLKQKDGQVKRYDVHCKDGIYTIANWEIYFKLFGKDGLLVQYARANKGSFRGAVVTIKRNYNGGHASKNPKELMKLMDMDAATVAKYIDEVKVAKKEQRLYDVTIE